MSNIGYADAVTRILRDVSNKRDMEVSEIKMNRYGHIVADGEVFSNVTDNALSQVFSRFNMPIAYERRLLDLNPELVADQFNFLSSRKAPDSRLLLRYREDGCNTLRAVLSSSYRPIDDLEVYKMLGDVLDGLNGLEVESFYLDENRSRMRVTIPSLSRSAGTALQKNDILKVGFDVINSEVGRNALQISPVVYRLVCTNGLKAWRNEGEIYRQRHSGSRSLPLVSDIRRAITSSIESSDALLQDFIDTKNIGVDSPLEKIKELGKKREYSDKFIELTQDSWRIEPDESMYGVINAFTRSAQTLDDEKRIDVEKFAGTLLKKGA